MAGKAQLQPQIAALQKREQIPVDAQIQALVAINADIFLYKHGDQRWS